MIGIPEAEAMLGEAACMNPGPWVSHSKNVALAARLITAKTNKHDPDTAYVYGLLHDIGRRNGVTHIKHVYDGYMFLKDKDRTASEICLCHTFPNKTIYEYQGDMDLDTDILDEMQTKLNGLEYGYFHKLILLCDGYGFTDGFISLEKRWIDAAIRLGTNEHTVSKWKSMYEIRKEIETETNEPIEDILGIGR